MKYSKYSVVIIGSGIAGLYAALKIEQQSNNLQDGVLLITKSKLGESNSRYAQGGMVAVMKDNKADSTESHISDTIKAGAGLSEFNTVKFISEQSDSVVKDLLEFGVEFDRDENNEYVVKGTFYPNENGVLVDEDGNPLTYQDENYFNVSGTFKKQCTALIRLDLIFLDEASYVEYTTNGVTENVTAFKFSDYEYMGSTFYATFVIGMDEGSIIPTT